VNWALLITGMAFPGVVALADCYQRDPEHFPGGARDRSAWLKWLVVALITAPIGVGYGILLGYHWNIVKRHSTMTSVIIEDDDWSAKKK